MAHQSQFIDLPDGRRLDLRGTVRQCPVCGARDAGKTRFSLEGFDLVNCSECKVMHLAPLPDEEALTELYNNNYFNDIHEVHGYKDYATTRTNVIRSYKRRLSLVKSAIPSGSTIRSVHEIGCAFGFGLEPAKEIFGCPVTGSDLSHEAQTYCRESGLECYPCDHFGRSKVPPDFEIDLLFSFGVVEHFMDWRKFLHWLDDVLTVGSIFTLTTPDMGLWFQRLLGRRSIAFKIPQHIIYFSTASLVSSLENRFRLLASWMDYEYMDLSLLLRRGCQVAGLPEFGLFKDAGPSMLIPNGMKLWVFEKC